DRELGSATSLRQVPGGGGRSRRWRRRWRGCGSWRWCRHHGCYAVGQRSVDVEVLDRRLALLIEDDVDRQHLLVTRPAVAAAVARRAQVKAVPLVASGRTRLRGRR